MDDNEDGANCPPKLYTNRNMPDRNVYSQPFNQYADDHTEDEDEGDEDLVVDEDDHDLDNGFTHVGLDYDVQTDDDDEDEDDKGSRFERGDVGMERRPKKRRLKSLASSYEFAPRIPASSSAGPSSVSKQSFGGRNSLTDWTENETFVLLDAWGLRFLQHDRKSLRSEEWKEVADKVSEVSKVERTDTQCRNRIDTLKKKYKKEKMKSVEADWVYFKKIDMLMSPSPKQNGVSRGLYPLEYVLMSHSPGNNSQGNPESGGLPLKKRMIERKNSNRSSHRLIANSLLKFGEMYERVEKSKDQQMVEIEKMRMDVHREIEMQRKQIMKKAISEIARIWQGDDEENNVSSEHERST